MQQFGKVIHTAFFPGSKRAILARAALLIAVIAMLDWATPRDVPFRLLYLLPMVLVGGVLEPWQIAIVALSCTFLAEVFDDLVWRLHIGVYRDLLYFGAYCGTGMFVREVNRNRKIALEHLGEIARQNEARREAEEQLRILIESSPAAILTADGSGAVLMANEAAYRMLNVAAGEMPGRTIHRYLPSLRNVYRLGGSQQFFRTVMQARAQREDGETFLADICFSTYRTEAGLRLAVMVLDASEQFRSHEVAGLHQLLSASRIAIGAFSHEIRNICGAIEAVHQNLAHDQSLAGNRDFEALGNLIVALERIASVDLRQTTSRSTEIDLDALLDELKIVIAPMLEEKDISLEWRVDSGLPLVWADRPSLMQVFLNLITNSIRAMATRDDGVLSIAAGVREDQVVIEFIDKGGGVAHPENLFQPFQNGASSSGLGLYLSRAFLRSFSGDIRYQPAPGGACFVVSLSIAAGQPV